MAKKMQYENYRVEVTPTERAVIRFGSKTEHGIQMDELRLLANSINRHIDDVESVELKFDPAPVCEFCGYVWGEDSDTYNGGCCGKDEIVNALDERLGEICDQPLMGEYSKFLEEHGFKPIPENGEPGADALDEKNMNAFAMGCAPLASS